MTLPLHSPPQDTRIYSPNSLQDISASPLTSPLKAPPRRARNCPPRTTPLLWPARPSKCLPLPLRVHHFPNSHQDPLLFPFLLLQTPPLLPDSPREPHFSPTPPQDTPRPPFPSGHLTSTPIPSLLGASPFIYPPPSPASSGPAPAAPQESPAARASTWKRTGRLTH